MGIHPMKGVWKSARMELGAPCVMISGIIKMPWWPADSWDSTVWVYIICDAVAHTDVLSSSIQPHPTYL